MELWILFAVIGYTIGAVAGILDKYMMNQQYHPVTTVLLRTLFNAVFLGTAGLLLLQLQITTSLLLLPPRSQLRRVPPRAAKKERK
jgi:predicted lysophospholipase L1 biosynthesis ABC-type transport system permease subunit